MLRMQTATDKEEFMSNLWMLKQLQTKFKKLSITHDYTKDERKAIRELVDEAKIHMESKRNETYKDDDARIEEEPRTNKTDERAVYRGHLGLQTCNS